MTAEPTELTPKTVTRDRIKEDLRKLDTSLASALTALLIFTYAQTKQPKPQTVYDRVVRED